MPPRLRLTTTPSSCYKYIAPHAQQVVFCFLLLFLGRRLAGIPPRPPAFACGAVNSPLYDSASPSPANQNPTFYTLLHTPRTFAIAWAHRRGLTQL